MNLEFIASIGDSRKGLVNLYHINWNIMAFMCIHEEKHVNV